MNRTKYFRLHLRLCKNICLNEVNSMFIHYMQKKFKKNLKHTNRHLHPLNICWSHKKVRSNHFSFFPVSRYIGGGGRYSMTCQNLIDKYSGESLKHSQMTAPSPVSASSLSSRWLSKSCADLSSVTSEPVASLRRSKSYSRITGNTGLSLVETDHVTLILASDWSTQIM